MSRRTLAISPLPAALAALALVLLGPAGGPLAQTGGDDDPLINEAAVAGGQPDLAAALDEALLGDDAAALAAADAASPSQEAAAKMQEIRRNEFFYQSYGKADPFKTLVAGKFEELAGGDLVDIGAAQLVGVMWGEDDQFALVEDGSGFGYILRVGDPVLNGRVVSIRKNMLTAKVTLYGITSTVTLKLERTEG